MTKFIISAFGDEIDADLQVQMDVLAQNGVSHIEFRAAYGKNVADHTLEEIKNIKAMMDARGFKVSAVGSPIGKIKITEPFEPHLEQFKHVVKIAKIFETPYIRLFSFFLEEGANPADFRTEVMRRMRAMVDVAEQEGVILLHENERYIYGDTPERNLDLVQTMNSTNFAITYDPANYVHCGLRNFPTAFPMLQPYVKYLHIKDCIAPTEKRERVLDKGFQNVSNLQRPAGEGVAQIREILQALHTANFEGFLSLEPHLKDEIIKGGPVVRFGIACDALKGLIKEVVG